MWCRRLHTRQHINAVSLSHATRPTIGLTHSLSLTLPQRLIRPRRISFSTGSTRPPTSPHAANLASTATFYQLVEQAKHQKRLKMEARKAEVAAAVAASKEGEADPSCVLYPIKRRWLPLKSNDATSSTIASTSLPTNGIPLTFVSYNLLAQCLVRRDMFPYCSKQTLKLSFRVNNLVNELLQMKADVMALQEVDRDLFETQYRPRMALAGYNAVWGSRVTPMKIDNNPATGNYRNNTSSGSGNGSSNNSIPVHGRHGCAIFYRADKFEVLSEEVIQFGEILSAPYLDELEATIEAANNSGSNGSNGSNGNGDGGDASSSDTSEALSQQQAQHSVDEDEIKRLKARSVYQEMNRPNVALIVGLKLKTELEKKVSKPPSSSTKPSSSSSATSFSSSSSPSSSSSSSSSSSLGLFVCTTHLFWDPRYRFVRLKQCQTMLDHLARAQSQLGTKWPSVVLGDFNVTPDNIIYTYLTNRAELGVGAPDATEEKEEWKLFLTPAEHGVMRGQENAAATNTTSNATASSTSANATAASTSSTAASSSSTSQAPSSNSGISDDTLQRLMAGVRVSSQPSQSSSSSSSSAASSTAPSSSPTPFSSSVSSSSSSIFSTAPIHQLRTALVLQSDGTMKQQDVEPEVDHATPASQLRLAEVKKALHHSRQLPLLKSLYQSYPQIVPEDVRPSVEASQASSYCRWKSEPPYTNYTQKFKGTLDYIFLPVHNRCMDLPSERQSESQASDEECSWTDLLKHSTAQLIPTHVLEIPEEKVVSNMVALPNQTISSDHISIAAKLVLVPKESNAAATEQAVSESSSSSSPSSSSSSTTAASTSSSTSSTSFASTPLVLKPFSPPLFNSLLRTKQLGRPLHYHPTVSSTMDQCKEAIFGSTGSQQQHKQQQQATHGALWLADEQTKGRGRVSGRSWSSPANANIYATLLMHFPSDSTGIDTLRKLNQCICIAIAQGMEDALCVTLGLSKAGNLPAAIRPRIKWPNDVWVGGRKTAGVLIDVEHTSKIMHAVIGVGINVFERFDQHPDPNLRMEAVSVNQALEEWRRKEHAADSSNKPPLTRELLLACFLFHLESLLQRPLKEVLKIYARFDMLLDQRIVVMPKKKEQIEEYYEAQAVAYSDEGFLVVQLDDGTKKELVAEEVSIRPSK